MSIDTTAAPALDPRTILIRNVPFAADEEALRVLCRRFAIDVDSVVLPADLIYGNPHRGIAFVRLRNAAGLADAVEALDGFWWREFGRTLQAEQAEVPRRSRGRR